MRAKVCSIILCTLFIIVSGCKKQSEPNPQINSDGLIISQDGDGLSSKADSLIATYSIPLPAYNSIFQSNGTPLYLDGANIGNIRINGLNSSPKLAPASTSNPYSKVRDKLISNMLNNAFELCEAKTFQEHLADGENKPHYWGYAYSYGQEKMNEPLRPPAGNPLHRQYYVYGTDCSGLIYNLLTGGGLAMGKKFKTTSFQTALTNTLAADAKFSGVKLLNLGFVDKSQVKTGDFILWPGHMGIIQLTSNKNAIVYQSNGIYEPKTYAEQATDWGPKRGVHPLSLSGMTDGFWGRNYVILRLVVIGDSLYGGNLFYLDETNKHGLIAAEKDQGVNVTIPGDIPEKGNITRTAYNSEFYSGVANTQELISLNTVAKQAALLCTTYSGGGYKDWYLPSFKELTELYKQKDIVGGFDSGDYTSSTWKGISYTDYFGPGNHAIFTGMSYINFGNGSARWVDGNLRGFAKDPPQYPVYPSANIRAIRKF